MPPKRASYGASEQEVAASRTLPYDSSKKGAPKGKETLFF
jgi:hypothetical protein